MNKIVLEVDVIWDEEAKVFVATSDDDNIPGLATEAKTFEELMERVQEITPELLALNNMTSDLPEIPIAFHQSHYRSVRLH